MIKKWGSGGNPISCRDFPSNQVFCWHQHRITFSGKPSWRGSLILLHPLVTDSKVQINVPPLLTACGLSTQDFLLYLPATQNWSV